MVGCQGLGPAEEATDNVQEFRLAALAPPGTLEPSIPIAASRAGGLGLLDLTLTTDAAAARGAVEYMARRARGGCGVRVDAQRALLSVVVPRLPATVGTVVLAGDLTGSGDLIRDLKREKREVLIEVTSTSWATRPSEEPDGLIAKGNEAGGMVGDDTTFILLQRLLAETRLPILAQGGIGLHTAAACRAAGAAGAVLDAQLLLTSESPLPERVRAVIGRMDGSETACFGSDLGVAIRCYMAPTTAAAVRLEALSQRLSREVDQVEARRRWRRAVRNRLGWGSLDRSAWPLGQDAAFAHSLAERYATTGRVLQAVAMAADAGAAGARHRRPMAEGAPLAQAHGTRYPIVQGPMTRVSDSPAFAAAVARGGALPFLSLAVSRGREVAKLLEATRDRLGDRPWGVGILGFVPRDLRDEQLAAIRACPPPFALIAGGRPDHARGLEDAGISTYLHVPSPALLELFVRDGARRFVFEGRECGGHVGPRSSFVLWESMVAALLRILRPAEIADVHLLFAGGVHDGRSAGMVAALGESLAEHGARIGVLLGTAYLFTREIVKTGAIVPGFQDTACRCDGTALLKTGPGHVTRCARTPFTGTFATERARLVAGGLEGDALRSELEALNLGRLRVAAKALRRQGEALVAVGEDAQRHEGMYMLGQLAALRSEPCTIQALHRDVADAAVRGLTERPRRLGRRRRDRPFDAAIVGMACLLPGAGDLRIYWDNIMARADAVTEVPRERWSTERYFDRDPSAPDKVYSRWGGFLDEVLIDPVAWGLPPAALPSIEPLQLLTLEVARAALADAGQLDRTDLRERTSVILGVGGGVAELGYRYALRAGLPSLLEEVPCEVLEGLPEWTEDSFPGILLNVAAGRVANRLDLGGVNYTVDAACASSLAAVHLGCRELEAGASDVVIVGGADTVQNQVAYMCFSKTRALSPTGRCRPFDAAADGIAISEGVAMVVLRRLADAERDGDRIYAVIRGVAGSSDGRHRALTAPRPEGQALALRRAYEKAGFSPATVGLVEAHGTGTVAGDAAEVETLRTVFSEAGAETGTCAIGSVKSMIGHTKSAAGAAGLVKAALALHHGVLPPTLHVEHPNPSAGFPESPFRVNSHARPWLQGQERGPRRAAVSAFGFGGTNFHAVLEEHDGGVRDPPALRAAWPTELLVWTAARQQDLDERLAVVESALADGARPRLRDLALATWRAALPRAPVRLAIVASSLDELLERLRAAREALTRGNGLDDPRGLRLGLEVSNNDSLAVLFPGQGSQSCGMVCDLALEFPEVRERFARADAALAEGSGVVLSRLVFPAAAFDDAERAEQEEALRATPVAQPALGAAGLGCMELLRALGIEPAAAAGHSYGEYVALAAAGAIGEDDLYRLSEARGRCIADAATGSDLGKMAAVEADVAGVRVAIAGISGAVVANLNGPRQTVVSGTTEAVDRALVALREAGLRARQLPVACGFHSPAVAPARDRFAKVLATAPLVTPHIPVFSNTNGAAHPADPAAISEALANHLVAPVDFAGELQRMYAAGLRVFVEAGPKRVLTGLVDEILDGLPHLAVALDRPGVDGITGLQHALAQLFAHGVAMDLERLWRGRGARAVDLERLGDERPVDPPPSAWWVDGGHARPAHQPRPGLPAPVGPERAGEATPAVSMPASVASSSGVRNGDEVLERFERLMSRFLDAQREVMLTYLAGDAPTADLAPQASRLAELAPLTGTTPPADAPAARPPDDRPRARNLIAVLTEIVAERTGYPSEVLEPDLDLEAGLGIDSIKRVEILAALQADHFPDAPDELIEILMGARTLRSIADMVEANVSSKIPGAASPSPSGSDAALATAEDDAAVASASVTEALPEPVARPAEQEDGHAREDAVAANRSSPSPSAHALARFVVERVEAPPPSGNLDWARGRVVVIVDDEGGVGARVASTLSDAGASVVTVAARDVDALGGMLADARGTGGSVGAIVDLEPLGAAHDPVTLLLLLQALAADLRQPVPASKLVVATALGGDGDIELATQAAYAGMVKALRKEWPELTAVAVHLDLSDGTEMLAKQVVSELACESGDPEVVRAVGRRLVPRLGPAPLDPAAPSLTLGPDDVVLVTGGARGITARAALELAQHHRPRLVLVGRTPWPASEDPALADITDERDVKRVLASRRDGRPLAEVDAAYRALVRGREMRAAVASMEAAGARVEYLDADLSDDAQVAALVDHISGEHGGVDVVLHGAGIIEDRRIEAKDAESFRRVMAAKAGAALALARRLDPARLRAFVLFSSVAGRFGNPGQIDYCAANAVLDELARRLDSRWPGRVVAIDWGPWDAGMASPELRRRFASRGIEVIDPVDGARACRLELLCGRPGEAEVIVGDGPWRPVDRASLPLLAGASPNRVDGRVEVKRVLDPRGDRFLDDHRIDGHPVLPAAVALEAFAELAQHEQPELSVAELTDFRVLRGLVLDGRPEPVVLEASESTCDVVGAARTAEPTATVQLQLTLARPGQSTPCYRGVATLARTLPACRAWTPLDGLEPFPVSVAVAYDRWLFQGPALHGIAELHGMSGRGIAATVRASEPGRLMAAAPGDAWLLDPLLLDSAFQLVMLWARARLGMTPLPAEIRLVRRHAAVTTPTVRCEVIVKPSAGGHVLDTDIGFFDARGRILAVVESMRWSASRHLNRVAGEGAS
jgi:acyl transferase domain-containing protein/NAD(P)H-dependent flavin oxidoreductase YrpB (nitropropane dioxygenase family)/NAD(P)-dependent dehydrogenase (short-subunit alcohol dehydrogenase family)/acyl carrier protein